MNQKLNVDFAQHKLNGKKNRFSFLNFKPCDLEILKNMSIIVLNRLDILLISLAGLKITKIFSWNIHLRGKAILKFFIDILRPT